MQRQSKSGLRGDTISAVAHSPNPFSFKYLSALMGQNLALVVNYNYFFSVIEQKLIKTHHSVLKRRNKTLLFIVLQYMTLFVKGYCYTKVFTNTVVINWY